MTTTEMIDLFNAQYGSFDSLSSGFSSRKFTNEIIISFLNDAQDTIYRNYYKENIKGRVYNNNSFTSKSLKGLIRTASFDIDSVLDDNDNDIYIVPNYFYYKLNLYNNDVNDLLYMINEFAISDNGNINVKPVTFDTVNTDLINPFKKPSKNVVLRVNGVQDRNDLDNIKDDVFLVSSISLSKYKMIYLKRINEITEDKTSELDDSIHRLIVKQALAVASKSTKPNGYQIEKIDVIDNI